MQYQVQIYIPWVPPGVNSKKYARSITWTPTEAVKNNEAKSKLNSLLIMIIKIKFSQVSSINTEIRWKTGN